MPISFGDASNNISEDDLGVYISPTALNSDKVCHIISAVVYQIVSSIFNELTSTFAV
jgi:hypothetical protein